MCVSRAGGCQSRYMIVGSRVIRNRGLFESFSGPWDRVLLVFGIDFSKAKRAVQQLYLFFCNTRQKIQPNHQGDAARAAMSAEYLGDKKKSPLCQNHFFSRFSKIRKLIRKLISEHRWAPKLPEGSSLRESLSDS